MVIFLKFVISVWDVNRPSYATGGGPTWTRRWTFGLHTALGGGGIIAC